MGQINVKQLGFALGAEVTGIDLRQPLNDLARKEILDAWHRHLVLVFPDQDLDARSSRSPSAATSASSSATISSLTIAIPIIRKSCSSPTST